MGCVRVVLSERYSITRVNLNIKNHVSKPLNTNVKFFGFNSVLYLIVFLQSFSCMFVELNVMGIVFNLVKNREDKVSHD